MSNLKERVKFLSQSPEKLKEWRGKELYYKLESLGLTYNHFFRAIGTNGFDYVAQEYGIDICRMTIEDILDQVSDVQYLLPDAIVDAIKFGFRGKAMFPAITIDDTGLACGQKLPLLCSVSVNEYMKYNEYMIHMNRLGERLALLADDRAIKALKKEAETTDNINDAWSTLFYDNAFTPTHRILKGHGTEPGKYLGAQYVNMDIDGELLIDAGYAIRRVGSGITIDKGMLQRGGVGQILATLDIDFRVLYGKAAIKIETKGT